VAAGEVGTTTAHQLPEKPLMLRLTVCLALATLSLSLSQSLVHTLGLVLDQILQAHWTGEN